MGDAPRIKAVRNGPLVVKNPPTIIDQTGKRIGPLEKCLLCRCGKSKNKPFCDNSHKEGFASENHGDARPDSAREYRGREVNVYYNRRICSHAGQCRTKLGEVFDLDKRPWIQPDNASAEEIEAIIRACPSGALQLAKPGDAPHSDSHGGAVIRIVPNGPIQVRNVELADEEWAEGANPQKYTLCRCGKSKNKPFCDGSHYEDSWKE